MSETAVSNTVAFLFGGMVFLLVYTRFGGMETVVFAGTILVVYLVLEAWHAWTDRRQAKRDVERAMQRLRDWANGSAREQSRARPRGRSARR